MSFILNALRKSEQERYARHSETLESRILERQEKLHSKKSVWLIILVLVNVFFLSYFIWSFTTEKSVGLDNEKEKIIPATKPEVKIKQEPKNLQPINSKKNIELSGLPIAEKIKQQTKHKPIFEQAKATSPIKKSSELKKDKNPLPLLEKQEVAISPKKNVVPLVSDKIKDLPFLSELDYEFRRTVPDIDINVFVYSEKKNDRFIMISMKKYVPGQLISTGMTLKDIRMNSIVVEYKNRVFQMKR